MILFTVWIYSKSIFTADRRFAYIPVRCFIGSTIEGQNASIKHRRYYSRTTGNSIRPYVMKLESIKWISRHIPQTIWDVIDSNV